uniref:Uncharacterized protein n=1 Tax=Timema cristinae TaxID=61476 RepID=A0A7R9GX96_TIMCR|nr:unnamed protein product [Timema cristinae]
MILNRASVAARSRSYSSRVNNLKRLSWPVWDSEALCLWTVTRGSPCRTPLGGGGGDNEIPGAWRRNLQECQGLLEENRRLQSVLEAPSHPADNHIRKVDSAILQSQVETLRWQLEQECQGLLEENRRLQSVLEAPSHPADNHIRKVDSAILQSQVETLRWQLEQTEASREMYRAVMEQVLKFLEKVHKNLEMTASDEGSPYSIKDMSRCRRRPRKLRSDPDEVPPEKLSQEAFRLFRTVQSLLNTSEPNLAQRLSISDCGDQSSVSSRATVCGGTPSTRERHEDVGAVQDASYSLPFTDSASQRSSRASKGEHCSAVEVPLDLRSNCGERTYNASPSVGSCSSLIQESYRKSPSIKSNSSKTLHPSGFANTALTTGLEASFSGCIQFSPNYTASLGRHRKIRVPNSTTTETEYYPYSGSNGCDGDKPPEKQLSISSNEDESGFSSMSSFQEVGLPIVNISPPISPEGKANYPEIGLPLVEHPPAPDGNNANHRRWSSSPVDTHSQFHKRLGTFTPSGEKLKVLWV